MTPPLPLSADQEHAVKHWAADDRLWTTPETVEFNLRTFARVILKYSLVGAAVTPLLDDPRVQAGHGATDEARRERALVIAPLVEAVEILEAIIYASDGCVGHRQCTHSMEPWQRARAFLKGKWEADERSAWLDVMTGRG